MKSPSSQVEFLIILVLILLKISESSPSRRESTIISNSMDWYDTSSDLIFTNSQLLKWTNVALRFFEFNRCKSSNIGSEDECLKLSSVTKSGIAVYVGYDRKISSSGDGGDSNNSNNNVVSTIISDDESYAKKREELLRLSLLKKSVMGHSATSGSRSRSSSNSMEQDFIRRKVFAILPDSTNTRASGEHDLILTLDPYPYANFGHLVGLFYIDLKMDGKSCKGTHQIYTLDGTCISVAKKPRCPNRLEKHTIGYQPRRCHVDFIPTVHVLPSTTLTEHSNNNGNGNIDLMECVNLPGFASCPVLRPLQDTQTILCDASHTNTKRCETSQSVVGGRCKLFQTCDRAVLIGGGWNRIHSSIQSYENILSIESMLTRIGFLPDNIKTFYANGGTPGLQFPASDSKPRYFSSAMKTGLRGHIRTICETKHCADTLFIYLNNPTTMDGDFLLWDIDSNGIAGELDVYSTQEFLLDIANCESNRVVIVADQSNTDILMSLLKDSIEHENVIITTAGFHTQISSNGELTNIWANRTHSMNCVQHIYQTTLLRMKDSTPEFFDSSQINSFKLSFIGAPCDLSPTLTSRELRSLYQGCQNVPTSVWLSLRFGELSGVEDDDDSSASQSKDGEANVSGSRRSN